MDRIEEKIFEAEYQFTNRREKTEETSVEP
jgi:hypothetical protein